MQDVAVLPSIQRTGTFSTTNEGSTIVGLPEYSSPETGNGTHKAQSITQKSLLALGFKRRPPFVTLFLFEAGSGTYPAYTDGSIIKGEVVLQSNEEESLQDVVVTFRGWTPSMGQKSRHDILYMEKRLDLPEALNLKTGKLPPGKYVLPFTIGPITSTYVSSNGAIYALPPSFVHNGFGGFVQYEINVGASRKTTFGVDAKIMQIVAYVPRSRPAMGTDSAMKALREGDVRPGPEEDEEGWDVKTLEMEDGGVLEIAIPTPLVYPRAQPLTILTRHRSSSTSEPTEDASIPPFKIELQQIATLGEEATEGETAEERPVAFLRVLAKVESSGMPTGWIGKGWSLRQVMVPFDCKPNFTFPKFSLSYRLAVTRLTGSSDSTPTISPNSPSVLFIPIVICTHGPQIGQSRTASPARETNTSAEIRVISGPEEVERVPQPSSQPGRKLLGGQKRVAPRVGPSDWMPVGSA